MSNHVEKAQKALEKVGLGGQDWMAARYLDDKPDEVVIYQSGGYWFVMPYIKVKERYIWTEAKLAFDTEELAIKFAKLCGAKYEID